MGARRAPTARSAASRPQRRAPRQPRPWSRLHQVVQPEDVAHVVEPWGFPVDPASGTQRPAREDSSVRGAVRELKTGEFRVRDGQTLILTGVIQDDVKELFTKWPILGDLPYIGQLFRSSSSNRQKSELVIIVTPSVLSDDNGGAYGYGYRPGTSAGRALMQAES